MSYEIDIDPQARHGIDALPHDALLALAEVVALLEIAPWSGWSYNEDHPDGALRTTAFGSAGLLTDLILDRDRRVDLLVVSWAG